MSLESGLPSPDTWRRLFPDADYRLPMNLHAGDARRFWALSPDADTVLTERRRWIGMAPERHLLFVDGCHEAVAEATAWLSQATGCRFPDAHAAAVGVEPDWVLLDGTASGGFHVLGGAVAFPSGWGLDDKLGRPLPAVHAPVPGLEATLGARIATFLTKLAAGAAWERENWGLSATPSLNHHPTLDHPRLDARATLDATWLRLEEQFLTRLPGSDAILFGIRVTNHRLDSLVATHPGMAARMARALTTMPEPLAAYKGLNAARAAILEQLARLA